MKYINKKTGVIIETESVMRGAWEEYDPSKQPIEENDKNEDNVETDEVDEAAAEEETNDEETEGSKELTVAEIKKELDAFGIEYPKRATKAELLKILKDNEE